MFAASAASAALSNYSVWIDTSSLNGTGALDFQFNPGNTTGSASAVISGFTGGTLISDPAPALTGDVSGTLPATVTINNTTQWNDYFTNITFGNSIKFNLALSGAALNSFYFSIFSDADGTAPALTSDATNGYAFIVDMNQDGDTITFNTPNGAASITPTPIPPSVLLLSSGLAGLGFLRRRFFRV